MVYDVQNVDSCHIYLKERKHDIELTRARIKVSLD